MLKAAILPELAVLGEAIALFVGNPFVAGFPWSSAAQSLDLSGSSVHDNHILDRVTFLLAAVELTLSAFVLWSLNWPLSAINDELEPRTLAKDRAKSGWTAFGEMLFGTERQIEHWCEAMDPIANLGLAHSKEEGLEALNGIDTEVEQDEQQSVGRGVKERLASATWLPFPRYRTLGLYLLVNQALRLHKRRQ
jgi:hypothetical protein